jgi:pilus assembly protein CpaD
MSSNRVSIARALAALSLAAAVAACASTHDASHTAKVDPPITPTEQFAVTVTPHEDRIMLAPHLDRLSPAQTAALSELVDRWRDLGDGVLRIETPTHSGEDVYRSSTHIEAALIALGVRPDQVKLADYDPGTAARPPVVVGFTRYEAHGPKCGQDWKSFTHSADNQPNSNFGCSVTANMAAMIANPADLVAPRESDPADAGRRGVVLTKYRQGQITSTPKDSQANGQVSGVAQ